MADMAAILRERLGADAAKVPKRGVARLPGAAMGIFDPGVRSVVNQLGEKLTYSSAKAEERARLGAATGEETVVETGRAMVAQA